MGSSRPRRALAVAILTFDYGHLPWIALDFGPQLRHLRPAEEDPRHGRARESVRRDGNSRAPGTGYLVFLTADGTSALSRKLWTRCPSFSSPPGSSPRSRCFLRCRGNADPSELDRPPAVHRPRHAVPDRRGDLPRGHAGIPVARVRVGVDRPDHARGRVISGRPTQPPR